MLIFSGYLSSKSTNIISWKSEIKAVWYQKANKSGTALQLPL